MTSNRNNKSAPKLRQSLLPFQPLLQLEATKSIVTHQKPPQVAADLPAEVWDLILSRQSNIVIKNFRLVCRYWAKFGAYYLFNTVYVDNYKQSWERFERLALSPYAGLVQQIRWNPLALPSEPLDLEAWRRQYSKILQDVKYPCSALLYQGYRKCVKTACVVSAGQGRPNPAFARLRNLHELILEDDIDIESTCEDQAIRRSIQLSISMYESVAMWGRYPRMWESACDFYQGEYDYRNLAAIFPLLRGCSTLSCCKLGLWSQNWRNIVCTDSGFTPCFDAFAHPTISVMHMGFKFCDVNSELIEGNDLGLEVQMQQAFQQLTKFPQLEEIFVEARFTDPGPDFLALYKRDFQLVAEESGEEHYCHSESGSDNDSESDHDSDNNSDSSSDGESSCKCFIDGDTLIELDYRYDDLPTGLSAEHFDSLRALFHPSLEQPPKLTILRLSGATIDVRSLIAWLCQRDLQNSPSLTIYLEGRMILHGFDEQVFHELMSRFGVNLLCDETVMYYQMEMPQEFYSKSIMDRDDQYVRHEEVLNSCSRTLCYERFMPDYSGLCLEIRTSSVSWQVEGQARSTLPSVICRRISTKALRLNFIHRPKWIHENIIRERINLPWQYYYCMNVQSDGRVDFYWTNNVRSFKHVLGRGNFHVLLIATVKSPSTVSKVNPESFYMKSSLSSMEANNEIIVYHNDCDTDAEHDHGAICTYPLPFYLQSSLSYMEANREIIVDGIDGRSDVS